MPIQETKKESGPRLWWRLIRFGFHLLYNRLAWSYDIVSWLVSLGEWRRWQEAALPFLVGRQVLEIAHGPGHMLQALAERDYEVTGLDLSEAMGRLAARRTRRSQTQVALVRGRVEQLPFGDQSFDSVLSTFPTAFITERRTMFSVYRVLRPGGRFVIVPEGHLTGTSLLHRFIRWLFVITGQRPGSGGEEENGEWPESSPLWNRFKMTMEAPGFQIEVQRISLERSALTVVIATRE